MVFSQGRKETILKKTEKKSCWKRLGLSSKVGKKHVLKLIALKQRSAVMKEKKAKYKVGDLVRIASKNVPFRKGYLQQFTNEIFSISTVFSTHPPSYILRDEKGHEIQGKFYEAEIIKVLK